MHILPNILQSKDNQTMKFGQLVDYNNKNVENEAGRLVPDLFIFLNELNMR